MYFEVGTEKTSAEIVRREMGLAEEPVGLTVQLFQRELLSFSDKAEHHEPGDQIEPRIEPDWSYRQHAVWWSTRVISLTSPCGSHDRLHSRESQAENTSYARLV